MRSAMDAFQRAPSYLDAAGQGFDDEAMAKIEKALRLRSISSSRSTNGRSAKICLRDRLGVAPEVIASPSFDLLAHLGFGKREIEAANVHVCGAT